VYWGEALPKLASELRIVPDLTTAERRSIFDRSAPLCRRALCCRRTANAFQKTQLSCSGLSRPSIDAYSLAMR
jgi:hypothetical protein